MIIVLRSAMLDRKYWGCVMYSMYSCILSGIRACIFGRWVCAMPCVSLDFIAWHCMSMAGVAEQDLLHWTWYIRWFE